MPERFHVMAWGSPDHPSLDYRTDEYPEGLAIKYPMVSVARLTDVTLSDIEESFIDPCNMRRQ